MVKGQSKCIRIKDVLHVPKLHANLLSVSKLLSNGCKVQFHKDGCIVRAHDGEVIARAPLEGNLYQVTFKKVYMAEEAKVAHSTTQGGALELWHRRLGHLHVKGVHALQDMVDGMSLGNIPCPTSPLLCQGCIEGKLHRKPLPKDGGRCATKPLEIMHSYVCSPYEDHIFGWCKVLYNLHC